jgi:hypothetical protein
MDNDYMKSPIELLMQKADTFIEVDNKTTYLGFCSPKTTATTQASWAVCKVVYSVAPGTYPRACSVLWANGQRQKNLKFSDYLTHSYSYRKF